MGNTAHYKTRMSNSIAINCAKLIELLCLWRPNVFILAEQPKGSFMFKTLFWETMLKQFFFGITLTYMGAVWS